jgi:hypothetical protein
MRQRTTILRVTALGVLAAMLIAADGERDTGAELDDHGWWWAMQTGLIELPAPPSVPEDGLLVGNGIDGPTAIAGIRYELDEDDAAGATLVLEVADEQGGEVAGIRACAAIARWRGAQAGTWEHRPGSDCDEAEVSGQRDEDGATWTFDLTPFVANGVANIILEPGSLAQPDGAGEGTPEGVPEGEDGDAPTAPEGASTASQDAPDGGEEPDSPPFQVAFEPPADGSVELMEGFASGAHDFEAPDPEASEVETDTDVDEPEPQDVPAPQSAQSLDMGSEPGPAPSSDRGTGSADPPEVAESEQPRSSAQDPVALVPPGEEQQAATDTVAMEPSGFGDDRIRQLAALVALVAGLGALVTWRSPANLTTGLAGLRPSQIVRPEQAARSLPGRSEGELATRGLGRFRRPRDGKAPPLT